MNARPVWREPMPRHGRILPAETTCDDAPSWGRIAAAVIAAAIIIAFTWLALPPLAELTVANWEATTPDDAGLPVAP